MWKGWRRWPGTRASRRRLGWGRWRVWQRRPVRRRRRSWPALAEQPRSRRNYARQPGADCGARGARASKLPGVPVPLACRGHRGGGQPPDDGERDMSDETPTTEAAPQAPPATSVPVAYEDASRLITTPQGAQLALFANVYREPVRLDGVLKDPLRIREALATLYAIVG